jgi:hypothetical protein
MKVLYFFLFLITYLGVLFGMTRLQQRSGPSPTFFQSFLSTSIAFTAFLAYVWILTGFWNPLLLGAFIGLAFMSLLTAKILWAVIGPDEDVNFTEQTMYIGGEYSIRYPWGFRIMSMLLISYLLFMPVVLGIAYFSNVVPSEAATQSIIRWGAVLNIIGGLLVFGPLSAYLLSSRNTNEDIRSIYAIQQISAVFMMAVWVGLALWAFNTTGAGGYSVPLGGTLQFHVSPIFLGILFGFLAITLVIPFVMGSQRGKKRRLRLFQIRKKLVGDLYEVLTQPKFDLAELQAISTDVEEAKEDLLNKEPVMKTWLTFAKPDPSGVTSPGIEAANDLFRKGRDTDIRFQQLDYFDELRQEIDEMAEILEKQTKPKPEMFVKSVEYKQKAVGEEIKTVEDTKPQIYALVFFVVTAVVSQIFSSFGQWAWELFTKTQT